MRRRQRAGGTAAEADATGNCHKNVCGSTGNVVSQIDNTDTPAEDGNQCTLATCNAGTPAQTPVTAGAVCNQNNGRVCSGTACVECVVASSCPGTDTICQQRTCSEGRTCGTVNAQAGIAAEPDATGNCHKAVCDGNGAVASQIDDTDRPAADTNQCTTATCAPLASPRRRRSRPAPRARRAAAGCAAARPASSASSPNDCTGTDTACQQRTCSASNTCGTAFTQAGNAAEPDATGNCHKAVCDGNGGIDSLVDDTDKPVDGNACTNDVCTAGVATNPALPAGTICNADNVHVCNAAVACNPLTFRVVRVGDGTAALSSSSTAVFVEERRLDGSLVGTIALPTAAAGANQPLTMSGSAGSEGALRCRATAAT